VVNYPDGRFAVQFEGTSLSFRVFDKIQTVTQGAIVENKRLGAALAMVKAQQTAYERSGVAMTRCGNGHRTIWRHPVCQQRADRGVAIWHSLKQLATDRRHSDDVGWRSCAGRKGCHLDFACRVTFQPCADTQPYHAVAARFSPDCTAR
jgi:hypothetical protein